MKRLVPIILAFALIPAILWAQGGPGGLGISVVGDSHGTFSGLRQEIFTCGSDPVSGGTGTGIVNVPVGFVRTFTKTANFTVAVIDCGSMYNNVGATGSVTFTLPAAAPGLWFGFTVDAAQTVEILANGTDQIAIGASNSSSHNITNGTAYGTVVLYAYKTGQWVAVSSAGTWAVN
jgi:hypothetical protein